MNILKDIKNDLRSIIYPIAHLDYRLAVNEVLETVWAEERRPQIQSGWKDTFVINLPAGISFKDFYSKIDYFKDAAGGSDVDVIISQKGKQVILKIIKISLDDFYRYEKYTLDGILPILLGYSYTGLEYVDLTDLPHLLIGGSTGGGKSNFLHGTIDTLLNTPTNPQIMLIDLKMSEYAYLEDKLLLLTELNSACEGLSRLVSEMRRRQLLLKNSRCVDIKKYNAKHKQKLSYIVLIIDELAELKDKDAQDDLETLLRLCRASGICIIAATQRPSSCMFAKKSFGDSKANFSGRLCFQVNSEIDKKIILDEYGTDKIPAIKGRAIWRHGIDLKKIQTMYFDTEDGGKNVQQHQGKRETPRSAGNRLFEKLGLLRQHTD